ncbi:MAG TPA: peptide chain release factor N(5)-glutamine methyltransferase [Candidatus Paceibacterota bacterium]|nr:peptide chain release factor N(5)-glutamine methyltransferase [Candidatus Paceibacterota bacterium]
MDPDVALLIRDKYGGQAHEAGIQADQARLAAGEPVAYVIGWQPFLGLTIYLDSKPLIPRPETEWWAEELINALSPERLALAHHRLPKGPALLRSGHPLRVLDLCAGSGAIGCAILKHCTSARVTFAELVPEHEATIWKNIRENGLDESRAEVRIGDLFAPLAGERFDIIASNPPYIPESRELDRSVTNFEPREALRAGDDGLALIRRIAEEAPEHLHPGGELWLECDSEHADAARDLIAARAQRAELRTDPYGRPRVVVGYY